MDKINSSFLLPLTSALLSCSCVELYSAVSSSRLVCFSIKLSVNSFSLASSCCLLESDWLELFLTYRFKNNLRIMQSSVTCDFKFSIVFSFSLISPTNVAFSLTSSSFKESNSYNRSKFPLRPGLPFVKRTVHPG